MRIDKIEEEENRGGNEKKKMGPGSEEILP